MLLLRRYLYVFMSITFIDVDGILPFTFFSKPNDFSATQNGCHFFKICCQVRRAFLCGYQFSHQIFDWFLVTRHSEHLKSPSVTCYSNSLYYFPEYMYLFSCRLMWQSMQSIFIQSRGVWKALIKAWKK